MQPDKPAFPLPASPPHAAIERRWRARVPRIGQRRDAIDSSQRRDWRFDQCVLPLAAFLIINFALTMLGGDVWIASHLYAWEGGHWALKQSILTQNVIHQDGKQLSVLAWLAVAIATMIAFFRPGLRAWRWPLLRLGLSVLLATSIVAILKHVTHMDCPWDMQGFGGNAPYFGLFDPRPTDRASGCFPAGHASAGYAWVALYFFFASVRPRWRWTGLGIGLGAGAVFGLSQQLRGAHFMSHDAWTLVICWTVALVMYRSTACGRIAWALWRATRAARFE
jgi:membrane-associated PAP2 superfamily phosphatase